MFCNQTKKLYTEIAKNTGTFITEYILLKFLCGEVFLLQLLSGFSLMFLEGTHRGWKLYGCLVYVRMRRMR